MPEPIIVEPIREQIIQACLAALAEIDGTGDYYTDLARIVRGQPAPDELGALPTVWLQEGDEDEPGQETNHLLRWRLPVTVEGWVRSTLTTPALATIANRLLGDIERALTADPTCGGIALATTITGRSTTIDPPPGSLASVRATCVIEYTTLRGNPASVG